MVSQTSPALSRSSTLTENPKAVDGRPLIESQAREGTSAFRPLDVGKARIEGTFSKIAYYNFNNKPACLIVVDLDFEFHEGCVFKDAQIRFNIESESQSDDIEKAEDGVQSVSSSKAVPHFGPRDHFGTIKTINNHDEFEIAGGHVGNNFFTGPEVKFCRKNTVIQESRWHVQGRADWMPRGQTYTWSVFGNKAACKDSASDKAFPRKVSIWMVVQHENKQFHADVEVTGRRRRGWAPHSWSSGHEKRGADRKVFLEPAPSTKDLNIDKLSQIIDKRNGEPNTYTSELDLESCFAKEDVLSNSTSEGKAKAFIRRRRPAPCSGDLIERNSKLAVRKFELKDDGGQNEKCMRGDDRLI